MSISASEPTTLDTMSSCTHDGRQDQPRRVYPLSLYCSHFTGSIDKKGFASYAYICNLVSPYSVVLLTLCIRWKLGSHGQWDAIVRDQYSTVFQVTTYRSMVHPRNGSINTAHPWIRYFNYNIQHPKECLSSLIDNTFTASGRSSGSLDQPHC